MHPKMKFQSGAEEKAICDRLGDGTGRSGWSVYGGPCFYAKCRKNTWHKLRPRDEYFVVFEEREHYQINLHHQS